MSKLILVVIAFLVGVSVTVIFYQNYLIDDYSIVHIPTLSFVDGGVYSGAVNDSGLAEGTGSMKWPNGSYYKGEFRNGMFHGKGKFVHTTGFIHEGDFVKGVPDGNARLSYTNSTIYEGSVKNGLLEGQGKMTYTDGSYYEGEFKHDVISGLGKWVKPNSYVYTGEVEDGSYHGKGEIVYENGNKYVGEFEKGELHGQGVYESKDGKVYSGQFSEGSFSGTGTVSDGDNGSHVGSFKDWRPEGQGVAVDKKGNQRKGNFENGYLNGKGIYIGKNGVYYEGKFEHGKYSGSGKLVDQDGNIYEGEFKYGSKHGKGTFTYKEVLDGIKTFNGRWRYDSLIEGDEQLKIYPSEEIAEFSLYNQISLLEKALDRVISGDKNQIELYTLGVAPYGSQEVFRREINFIEDYFNRVYKNKNYSVYLSNSRRAINDRPLATLTSLERSIEKIGDMMNKDQDILFLYITSHGSKDKEISFNQKGLTLPDLTAEKLNDMLEKSGIKWKVVVLSACYSGGFIDAIKDDYSIILTASAADKRSFGCDDNNQFTYFGAAFFKEGLPASTSFVDAFEKARNLIEKWEDEKDYEHSNPQIHKPQSAVNYLQKWRESQSEQQLTVRN